MTEGIIRSIRFLVGEAKEPQNADITEAERISDLERSAEDAANELDRLLDASAAKDAEIARLREAFDPDRIHAQTIEAMTDAWNDICADTGCHPLDIERKGRELTFSPRHWADQTATWLIVKLCGETESDEATLKEPSHG